MIYTSFFIKKPWLDSLHLQYEFYYVQCRVYETEQIGLFLAIVTYFQTIISISYIQCNQKTLWHLWYNLQSPSVAKTKAVKNRHFKAKLMMENRDRVMFAA